MQEQKVEKKSNFIRPDPKSEHPFQQIPIPFPMPNMAEESQSRRARRKIPPVGLVCIPISLRQRTQYTACIALLRC